MSCSQHVVYDYIRIHYREITPALDKVAFYLSHNTHLKAHNTSVSSKVSVRLKQSNISTSIIYKHTLILSYLSFPLPAFKAEC